MQLSIGWVGTAEGGRLGYAAPRSCQVEGPNRAYSVPDSSEVSAVLEVARLHGHVNASSGFCLVTGNGDRAPQRLLKSDAPTSKTGTTISP